VPRGTDLVGKVTDGKVGLANSYLFVCDAAGEIGCAAATGAADGSFRIQHVPTGDFTIFVSVPGRVIGWYQPKGFTVEQFAAGTVHVVSGGPDVTGVKIVVPPGASISGRITGSGGVPIAGARVLGVPSGIPPNFVQPVSGADGRYIVTGLPTNQYALSVRPPEGSDYIGGYYQADGPGHFTASFGDATMFRVIEDRDKDAPVIGFRDPAPNATGIDPREASLQIRFSEPVDNATPSTIQLRDPRGRVVPITIDVEPEFRGVTIHPVDELLAGTKYRLTLTNGIVDWSGNHFAGASWSFTTSP
jgi:hypothetical protein